MWREKAPLSFDSPKGQLLVRVSIGGGNGIKAIAPCLAARFHGRSLFNKGDLPNATRPLPGLVTNTLSH